MKKAYLLPFILFPLLSACSLDGTSNGGENNNDNNTQDSGSSSLTYERIFNPSSKIDIELNFKNKAIYSLEKYGTSGDFNKEEIYHPCDVKIQIDDDKYTFAEVGAKMKGNTSRYDNFIDENGKFIDRERLCHFKLAFDKTFNSSSVNDYYSKDYTADEIKERDARRIASMKKIDLKWNKNYDSSFTKEIYALDCFAKEGVAAQKANLINLTIKSESDSITMPYILFEVVDKTMLKRNFTDNKGDLYKCTYTNISPADLSSVESNKFGIEAANYKPPYDLKTNEDTSDFSVIKNFITKTSTRNVSASDIKPVIDSVLNVDNFLKFAAMSWVVGSPDDYRNNYNNYYMYFDSKTNLAYFIPYDNDRVFGILKDWPIDTSRQACDSDRLNGTASGGGCSMPIVRRLLVSGSSSRPVISEYQTKFKKYCKDFANKYLNEEKFKAFTNQFYYSSKVIDNSNSNMSFKEYAINKLGTLN